MKRFYLFIAASLLSSNLFADSVKKQIQLTHTSKLKNRIPVVVRNVDSSDILVIDVSFKTGIRDLAAGKKALNNIGFKALPFGSKNFPKQKLDQLLEKESIAVECEGGIEISHCMITALSEQLDLAVHLISDIIIHPEFDPSSMENLRARLVSEQMAVLQNPDRHVNEIVNQIYYPKNHPYRLDFSDAAEELKKIPISEIKSFHSGVLDAGLMQIVAISNLKPNLIANALGKYFSGIKVKNRKSVAVADPKYSASENFKLVNRDIPTAYLRAKFPVPGQRHKDAVATRLTFDILSEDLMEEIRTKRSLSYSVFATPIQHTVGIGVIAASTPKPKETLEAIEFVLRKIMTQNLTKEQLNEYKTGLITTYYQTLESHQTLANALGSSLIYFGNALELYKLPAKVEAVTSADVKRIANQYLKEMRLGVLFNEKKFERKWADTILK